MNLKGGIGIVVGLDSSFI